MSNELIEIQETTVLEAFSTDNGLDQVINQARELVANFEHDLSTAAGRKRTASLAAKVAKLKTKMDGLGKSLTDDWAKKKKAVDVNRKAMRDQLDELKKEARKPLDEWEAEQAEIERKKLVETDHEIALLMNEKFDADRAAAIEVERKAEAERQAQLKAEQEEREKRIAEEAAASAKAEAEAAKQRAIEAEARAKVEAEQAEKRRIEAEKQAKLDAERAAEQAKQAEIARQQAEAKRIADEQAAREANKRHIGAVRKAAKESLMQFVDEETAKKIVMAIHGGEITNVKIHY